MATLTAPLTIQVLSETHPGKTYHTSSDCCSCPSFVFSKVPGFRCKHMLRWFSPLRPALKACERPGCPFAARQLGCFCSDECMAVAVAEEMIAANDEEWSGEAGYVLEQLDEAESVPCKHGWAESGSAEFACTKCGKVHSYAEDAPLRVSQTRPSFSDSRTAVCPGYLREHPATAERVATFWCDVCTPDDCR